MKWAEQLGAKCSECPLGKQTTDPVAAEPPTGGRKPRFYIIGDSPTRADEAIARPFQGSAESMLNDALKDMGVEREECHITNAVKCRPHRKLSGKEWEQVRACCQPLLQQELADATRVIGMGSHALTSLTGVASVTAWRGYPLPGDGLFKHLSIFPMATPASLFTKPANLPIWLTDLQRGFAFASGSSTVWEWPKEIIDEGPELLAFLKEVKADKPEIALDVETTGKDPFVSTLTALGLARWKDGKVDVAASFDWPPQSREIRELFIEIVQDETIPKILQNGTYDWIVLSANGIDMRGFAWDTLFAGCVIAPQIAHDLGNLASVDFFAPRWKSEFKITGDSKGAQRFIDADRTELKIYNARDNTMTLWLKKAQEQRLKKIPKGQERLDEMMRLGELGKRMKVRGMLVDAAAREVHKVELTQEVGEALGKFTNVVGTELNWQSTKQLHELFFQKLGVQPTQYDKLTGNPKLDGAALADIVALYGKEAPGQAALHLHRLRERSKLLATYVTDLPVATWDGCVHPWWKFFTVTGRWNCGEPNMQNIPKPIWDKDKDGKKYLKRPGLRDMFIARPGMWLVEADYSQLELRILALLAGDVPLLDAYAKGLDVHALNACALFAVSEASKNQRDFAKRFVYGLNYGGGDKTVHKSLVVNFPSLTIEQVAEMRARWEGAHPQIATWQKDQVLMGRIKKYVEAPLSNRRFYFYLGRVEPTICYNYPMQSTGADIVNRATLAIDPLLGRKKQEAILLQVHDALVLEGPDPDHLARLMKKEMSLTVTLNGKTMMFPVDIQVGKCWGKMEPWSEK